MVGDVDDPRIDERAFAVPDGVEASACSRNRLTEAGVVREALQRAVLQLAEKDFLEGFLIRHRLCRVGDSA